MAVKRSFIKSMLSDSRSGEVSTKRVIGAVGFLSLLIIMFVNALYSKSIAPSGELIDAIEYIVIAALFGTSIEKFVNNKKPNDTEI